MGALDHEAKMGGKRYLGTASNYLEQLEAGDKLLVSVRPSHHSFHDVENTPSIMICAGSGLAPFRGFVQERAKQLDAGHNLVPAKHFIGCRHQERDALYSAQMQGWVKNSGIDVRYAFSKATHQSDDCKYGQDRLQKDLQDALEIWDQGGKIYVCGNGDISVAVKEVFIESTLQRSREKGQPATREEVEAYLSKIKNDRFVSDVFCIIA